ncbi:hypothetical protein M948_19335 [Virgibacillus sp. CM-4]|uniref:helix-turn-helix domain-containing protein n=1 Tax=Virgibacillus sp. CM-4 TaxID=1354277 RepID=UPI00038832F4|nr:helix-turn-helix transcriptional regulator [Virgibacillus sp. CM-4]EQB35255.1 hypothetical protein M948_19335 [Virgibacillus sp. CM-4]
MKYEVVCNLKKIMEQRKEEGKGKSIRQIAELSDLKFETVRKIYNDDMKQYHRESIAAICIAMDIKLCDLLEIKEVKN